MNPPVTFTRAGLAVGVRRTLPIALGDFAFGIVFGVVARQAGLSLSESVLMSGMVFAGAAQFIAIGLWTAPLPIVSLIVTTLVVNLRHLLMGAALRPWFARLAPGKAYGSLFFLTDETWALLAKHYDPPALVEILFVVGQYTMLSMVANAAGLDAG